MIDESDTPTWPGGTVFVEIPDNKLRVKIEETQLFFTIETKIKLFAGNFLISTSKVYDQPPTNKQINLFVVSQILSRRNQLIKLGVDISKEIKNFSD